ncbi:hypothetical protein Rhal01_01618 [Rubritalea halochordaticola]|uniref:DUF1349 domain-containing protein n=1 Tax=Rubritalea halochordaticola TaxID=714537 RepID=A0ABP9UYA7_9BACT
MKRFEVSHVIKVLCAGLLAVLASCSAPVAPAPYAASMEVGTADTARARPASYAQKRSHAEPRPGLGTSWGNEVESPISYTNFKRSSDKPNAVEKILYNDAEGVDAMAGPETRTNNGLVKAKGGLVEWGIKSGWGYSKNVYGRGNRFVVGSMGKNYSLVVKNLSNSRLEIVLSVDGLDVMDGKPASFAKRGYIVTPGHTLTVDGFRTSEDAVAAFKFSTVGASYSNLRHDTTRNVGVIGMAVFTEKGVDPWKWSKRELERRRNASPFAEAPPVRAR